MLPDFARAVMKDTVELHQSISEIESMIASITRASGEVMTLSIPNWEAIANEIDKAQAFQHTTRMYRRIHLTQLENIIGDARNRTAELLGELRKTAGRTNQVATDRKADAIVSGVVVSGSGNSVIVTSGKKQKVQTGDVPSESKGWWGAWGKAATVITVVVAVLTVVIWGVVVATGANLPTP